MGFPMLLALKQHHQAERANAGCSQSVRNRAVFEDAASHVYADRSEVLGLFARILIFERADGWIARVDADDDGRENHATPSARYLRKISMVRSMGSASTVRPLP